MRHIVFGGRTSPRPTGESYSAPQTAYS